jgi:hypothetical protein
MNPRVFLLPALVASTVALFASGCSASSSPLTAPLEVPQNVEKATPSTPRVLVWTVNEDGEHMTWTLDDAGEAAELRDGIRIAARGGVWDWHETVEKLVTTACPTFDDSGVEQPPGDAPEPGTGVRITLEREDGGGRTELVAPESAEGAQDLEQTVDLVASVGPYLFIRESTYAYTCGAHGNVGVSFRVHDAERGVDVWTSTDGRRFVDLVAVARETTRARNELVVDEDVAAFVADGELPVDFTAILPSYDTDGALEIGLQFTAAACYACSDGAWSSYTKSTTEPLDALPAALRPWATPPAGVSAFLHDHPTLTLGGWTRLPSV